MRLFGCLLSGGINENVLHFVLSPSCMVRMKSFVQFVIFKLLSYCFEETIGFDREASFASRRALRLIR